MQVSATIPNMVSRRMAKKSAAKIKERWKRIVIPFKPASVANGFIIPCQEMVLSQDERVSEELSKPSSAPQEHSEVPPFLVWIFRVGGFTFLVGGLTMITTPNFFWLSVFLVYCGLLLLAVEIYAEPALRRLPIRLTGWTIVIAFGVWYSVSIVFVSAPLRVSTLSVGLDYSVGDGPAGISWRPYYAELTAIFTNPTKDNYDDINLLVRPDFPVAALAQASQLSGFSYEDKFGMNARIWIEDLANHQKQGMDFLATNAGYKIHCDRIPPDASLKVTMALVNFNPARVTDVKNVAQNFSLSNGVHGNEIVNAPLGTGLDHFAITATIHETNGGDYLYWYGSPKNSAFYLSQPIPKRLSVGGTYVGANRIQTFPNQEVEVK